jgi:chromosome segregation ATPase
MAFLNQFRCATEDNDSLTELLRSTSSKLAVKQAEVDTLATELQTTRQAEAEAVAKTDGLTDTIKRLKKLVAKKDLEIRRLAKPTTSTVEV